MAKEPVLDEECMECWRTRRLVGGECAQCPRRRRIKQQREKPVKRPYRGPKR